MPAEAAWPVALHATAVAIGERALLIRGAARAGKSRLALALVARATAELPIHLIGDDRILLHPVADGLVARPHPRIAGFIERRGLGLVAMPWIAQARVGGLVDLDQSAAPPRHSRTPKANPEPLHVDQSAQGASSRRSPREPRNDALWMFPQLLLTCAEETERAERVLAWWAGLNAAWAPHLSEKAGTERLADAKD